MSDLITIFKNERSVVLPQSSGPEMLLIVTAEICSELGRAVCIEHLHTLLMMVLVEIESQYQCHGV